MDKQHIKGAIDKAKGSVKASVGKATGNRKLEMDGEVDKAKGSARGVIGDVKDALKKK